jgi:hypothetical protein
MATLTNTKIKDTYDGLLKTSDNGSASATYKEITDGLGNGVGVFIGTSGGVKFGTASDSTFDDYEEGTFTPEVADAETGGNVAAGGTFNGVYTKIGRQVTVAMQNANIDTTGMTAGNDLWIRNLPFTSGGFSGSPMFIGATRVSAITASANSLGFQTMMAENTSAVRIAEMIDSANSSPILVSSINSGASDIWITLTYFTN